MAPLKQLQPTALPANKAIKTRSQILPMKKELPKRKAEESPLKRLTVKRSALNEVTNVTNSTKENAGQLVKAKITTTAVLKKPLSVINKGQLEQFKPDKTKLAVKLPPRKENGENQVPSGLVPSQKTALAGKQLKEKPPVPTKPLAAKADENGGAPKTQITTRRQSMMPVPIKAVRKQQIQQQVENHVPTLGVMTRRSLKKSLELEKTSDTSSLLTDSKPTDKKASGEVKKKEEAQVKQKPPPGVCDYDKEMEQDIFSASIYAMKIFDYLKSRESSFVISDYLERQKDLSASMRAILVDWMVDIQESYELVHESLYLGVKLVDLFLSKHVINRDRLQLVGAACLFVACKYDERLPPSLDDFMATCDNQYQATEFLKMELMILRTVDYSLGIPLSYRFLRRYARCAKYDMLTLTLARYILEANLMNYKTVRHSDSKMAAAALFLALQMEGRRSWTKTLEYYSGYRTEDFIKIAYDLNDYLAAIPRGLKTVKAKYSHGMFYEVSKIPHLPNGKLDFATLTVS